MKKWAATGFLPCARQTTRSLSTPPRPVLGEPVAHDVDEVALRQVVLRVDRVAGPHLAQAVLPGGEVGVHGRSSPSGPSCRRSSSSCSRTSAMSLWVGAVHVVLAVAQQHHAHRRVPVVEDRQVRPCTAVSQKHVVGVVARRRCRRGSGRCASRCRCCRSCTARCTAQPRSYHGSRKPGHRLAVLVR